MLVALAVIGVVAALTIPNLMQNWQEKAWKNSFKKIYSDLNQATLMIMADNGGTMANVVPSSPSQRHDDLREKYLEHMSYVKKCNKTAQPGVCWHDANGSKYLNGNLDNDDYLWTSRAIINNGTLASFHIIADLSSFSIRVDVNGFKGPNIWGKDLFYIAGDKDGIKPGGTPGSIYQWSCDGDPNDSGMGCAVKVLKNEDY